LNPDFGLLRLLEHLPPRDERVEMRDLTRELTKSEGDRVENTVEVSTMTTTTITEPKGMTAKHPSYAAARKQLILFLRAEGFKVHPNEVYCPSPEHCWVDVAALKGQDYWAFEYKSRNDSIKRGLAQCQSYSNAFNYVVLVADRHRTTAGPYFSNFKRNGFGVWSHTRTGFNPLLKPQRRSVPTPRKAVIERQFRRVVSDGRAKGNRKISEWFAPQPIY
jgi:hypothetical protein